jgi:hypothetical protein
MGIFDKQTSSTQTSNMTGTSNTTGTSRRYNPAWVEDPTKKFVDQISGLGEDDPLKYFAGADPLQAQGARGAAGLTGTPWNYESALGLTSGVANAAAPRTEFAGSSGMIKNFYNPFMEDVLNATKSDMDFDQGQNLAQQDLDITGQGGFGGSGTALTRAATAGAFDRNKATVLGNLRFGGFNTALQAAQNEAARKQSANDLNAQLMGQGMDRTLNAAGQISDISDRFGANERANIGVQDSVGSHMRDISQGQAQAPLDLLKFRTDLFNNLGLENFGGTDTTGTTDLTSSTTGTTKGKNGGSAADKAGTALQIAALFASDRRLKRDIKLLHRREDDLGVYLYRYLWSPVWFIGVMAQEVLRIKPGAVAMHPDGYLMVDYARI